MPPTREANGAIRHQATAVALGQAAGHLAAHAAVAAGEVHKVPAPTVQQTLAAAGAIATRMQLARAIAAE